MSSDVDVRCGVRSRTITELTKSLPLIEAVIVGYCSGAIKLVLSSLQPALYSPTKHTRNGSCLSQHKGDVAGS
jgi:hypothetical protein